MTDLTGKVALVTGSARGLGRAIAQRYAALGAGIVVNYAGSEQAAAELVAHIEGQGGKAIAVRADVSKVAEINRLFDIDRQMFGRPDIVVANAGIELVGAQPPVLMKRNSIGCSSQHQGGDHYHAARCPRYRGWRSTVAAASASVSSMIRISMA